MKYHYVFTIAAIVLLSTVTHAQDYPTNYFSTFYGGFEVGTNSYNTQITFDGVNDPAGRGGLGYSALFGYNHTDKKWVVGSELSFHFASVPNPYTFDPAVTGFAELDLRRDISVGLDIRTGYLVVKKILIYGNVGYSVNRQSVRIDNVPLDQFEGGAGTETFGALQFGGGLEFSVLAKLSMRTSFKYLGGHDLSAIDFGTIPTDASLTRFDVEPSQQQFLLGLIFHF
ncbi:MAG: outer membrane protein [Calditrichia bacterium]